MIYATQVDYTTWLMGRASVVPLTEFDFWAREASRRIDQATFNRLHDKEALAEHGQAAMEATCAVAEIMFQEEKDGHKMVTSVKIDDASEGYARSDAMHPQARINDAIRNALIMTGLMSRYIQ